VSEWPELFQDHVANLRPEEVEIVKELLDMGQQHLFATWDPPGTHDEDKHKFFEQYSELDKSYVGGISTYLKRARLLLAGAKRGDNPYENWIPEVPSGVLLDPVSDEYYFFEQKGVSLLGSVGFVLVAGGLGERLGYDGVKLELPTETLTNTCYLELYCQQILSIQKRYAEPGKLLPLAIMVSDDTMQKTKSLLEDNLYYGLSPKQVTLMKQNKVPALLSNSGHIALSKSYTIDTKPHGHGDVHSLLFSMGIAQRWSDQGIKHLVFFQDTNGLGLLTLPAMLGVSEEMELEVNFCSVKRYAKQAIGALAKLVHSQDGREMNVNIEYNQLDPMLRATTNKDGDINDPATGCSPYPGNINQLVFKLEPYLKVLNKTSGVMPEFVNPKYKDSSKNLFKKPTRLECMMQDYPKLLSGDAKVGFTCFPDWFCYSPCKNNAADAAAFRAQGIPAASCYSAESDQYYVFGEILRRMGANIHSATALTILGISAVPAPRIVLHPSFAMFPYEIAARFVSPWNVNISANSSLYIEGEVIVDSLSLEGALRVIAAPGTFIRVKASTLSKDCEGVTNEGHVLKVINEEDVPSGQDLVDEDERLALKETDVMRGYVIVCNDVFTASTLILPPSPNTDKLEEYVFTGSYLVLGSAFEDFGSDGCCNCDDGCGYC